MFITVFLLYSHAKGTRVKMRLTVPLLCDSFLHLKTKLLIVSPLPLQATGSMLGSGKTEPAVCGLRELAGQPGGLVEGQEGQPVKGSVCLVLWHHWGVVDVLGVAPWHSQHHREQATSPSPREG